MDFAQNLCSLLDFLNTLRNEVERLSSDVLMGIVGQSWLSSDYLIELVGQSCKETSSSSGDYPVAVNWIFL